MSQDRTLAEHVEALAALPLQHQPGEVWEYSMSIYVLGRVIEVIEGCFAGRGFASSACSARSA